MITGNQAIVISIDDARELLQAAEIWPGSVNADRIRSLQAMGGYDAVMDLVDIVRKYDEQWQTGDN